MNLLSVLTLSAIVGAVVGAATTVLAALVLAAREPNKAPIDSRDIDNE